MAAPSAGFTRDSTRSKLREQFKVNDLLRKQMLDLNALLNSSDDASIISNMTEITTKSTRQQLAEALAALQLMQQNQAPKDTTQPKAPAQDKPTDTKPGGVGHQI
jgi:septal ring factor EnvC (AmiA/AmiB activator)